MAEEKNNFDPDVVLPKIKNLKKRIIDFIAKRKKLVIGLIVLVIVLFVTNAKLLKPNTSSTSINKGIQVKVAKGFDFTPLNNQGKLAATKIKLTIANAEKTDQVLVTDKTYTAKNDKMFLIINLELKNDAPTALNILPGDLLRLTYNSDEENKFAPDLHNNLVLVSAISTKLDRVGFVIPKDAKSFKLYVGELEGKKETVEMVFPS